MERIRHLGAMADIQVVAPVPWFRTLGVQPLGHDTTPLLGIHHPRFWYIPKVLKSVRGLFLFLSVLRYVRRLRKSFDFDLIDAHFAYPDGFVVGMFGRRVRRPVCFSFLCSLVQ